MWGSRPCRFVRFKNVGCDSKASPRVRKRDSELSEAASFVRCQILFLNTRRMVNIYICVCFVCVCVCVCFVCFLIVFEVIETPKNVGFTKHILKKRSSRDAWRDLL